MRCPTCLAAFIASRDLKAAKEMRRHEVRRHTVSATHRPPDALIHIYKPPEGDEGNASKSPDI